MKFESVLGECQDGVGSGLQWKKWEFRDGFRKLMVSDFKNLYCIHMMCNTFC